MTLPSPGVSLSLDQINTEAQLSAASPWYNRGPNLGAYHGVQWWKDNTQTGYFPTSSISINDFYDKRSTSPVTPGSQTYSSPGSFSFTVPLYSVLTVTIRGGAGGGAGQGGNRTDGGNGGWGGDSLFGGYGTGYGGGGGIASGDQAGSPGSGSDGSPAGGGGWGPGGAGGKTVLTLLNPISGGSGPAVGSTVSVYVAYGGAGGSAGTYWVQLPNATYPAGIAGFMSGGNPGGNGSVVIQWT